MTQTSENNDTEGLEKNVKIFVRIFPTANSCESYVWIDVEHKRIHVKSLQEVKFRTKCSSNNIVYWSFNTDGIFDNSSQEEIYNVATRDLAEKVLDGINSVLFGYGQTGCGKTFTISGLSNNWEHRGLIARLLSDLFLKKTTRRKVNEIRYSLSFVELHGKDARDLLSCDPKNKVKIHESDPFKELTLVEVKTEEEALRRIFEGDTRRLVVRGSSYSASHLGTTILTFHVCNTNLTMSWQPMTVAQLHIVELAGTDSVGRNNDFKTPHDIGLANLTKVELERFFLWLKENGSLPYNVIKTSNLLKILKRALTTTSIIRFILHVRVTKEDLDITLSTLKFGANIGKLKFAKTVKDIRIKNEIVVKKLQEEVDMLRKELQLNYMLLHQEPRMNISKTREEQIKRGIFHFLNGSISEFKLMSYAQAEVLLKAMKELYNNLKAKEEELEKLRRTNISARSSRDLSNLSNDRINNQRGSGTTLPSTRTAKNLSSERVGHLDKSATGITIGPTLDDDPIENTSMTQFPKHVSIPRENFPSNLFERFLTEEKDYNDLNEKLVLIEINLSSVRATFSNTTDKYVQVKNTMENSKNELVKLQKHRRFIEIEKYDKHGTRLISQEEKTLAKDIACYEKMVENLEEDLSRLQDDIRSLIECRNELCAKLEAGFRDYCKQLRHGSQLKFKNGICDNTDKNLEIIKRTYNQLRRIHLNQQAKMNTVKQGSRKKQ